MLVPSYCIVHHWGCETFKCYFCHTSPAPGTWTVQQKKTQKDFKSYYYYHLAGTITMTYTVHSSMFIAFFRGNPFGVVNCIIVGSLARWSWATTQPYNSRINWSVVPLVYGKQRKWIRKLIKLCNSFLKQLAQCNEIILTSQYDSCKPQLHLTAL